MLYFLACLCLISRSESLNYIKLVGDVGIALDECLGIVDSVRNYVVEVESLNEHRRRTQNDEGDATNLKLKACVSILDAVDTYRDYHSVLLLIHEYKFIQWQEMGSLNELLKPVLKRLGVVLYVASRDGGKSTDFHKACDKKGPTVVIVETTTGVVFGGYTDVSWGVSDNYFKSSTAFLFQLRPNVRKCAIKDDGTRAIYSAPNHGPTFGAGHDLHIDLFVKTGGYVRGKSYACKRFSLNEGKHRFQVKQYIVLKAMDL